MHPIERDKSDASLLDVFRASVDKYAVHRGYIVKKCIYSVDINDAKFKRTITYCALIDTPHGEEYCTSTLPYGPFLWRPYEPNKLMAK